MFTASFFAMIFPSKWVLTKQISLIDTDIVPNSVWITIPTFGFTFVGTILLWNVCLDHKKRKKKKCHENYLKWKFIHVSIGKKQKQKNPQFWRRAKNSPLNGFEVHGNLCLPLWVMHTEAGLAVPGQPCSF